MQRAALKKKYAIGGILSYLASQPPARPRAAALGPSKVPAARAPTPFEMQKVEEKVSWQALVGHRTGGSMPARRARLPAPRW
mgnify:CR=1 FL=1